MGKTLVVLIAALVVSLCQARTVRWTSAGANGQWDFSQNWDCNCIPTMDDDVIIDVPNIPGNVKIAANPAFCKSLTVGGTSSFGQSLYVQGKLSIGSGGGVINPNGDIVLDASPVAPLSSDGIFSGSNRFIFKSGTLGGRGQFIFESINFTTPASKTINATTTVRGLLWVQPGAGANALINIAAQTLTITGIIRTEEALTIASDDTNSASIDVQGQLNFYGPGKQYIIRGYASINNLTVFDGDLSIQNAVDIVNAVVSPTASISLIGGPENKRNFGLVSGQGRFIIQGGDNTMKVGNQVGKLIFNAGKLSTDGKSFITGLILNGGEFAGSGTVAASYTNMSFGILTSLSLTTASLDLSGSSTLSSSSLTVTSAGRVSSNSQFTLNAGATFNIANSATFTQANQFAMVPGADSRPPVFKNDGTWNANQAATINVNSQGSGTYNFLQGSSFQCTGVTFSTNNLNVQTTAKFLGVTGNIGTLSGNGYVELNGRQFQINSANAGVVAHLNGQTQVNGGTMNTLYISNGNFIVSGKVRANALNFTSGTIQGAAAGAILGAGNTIFSSPSPKSLNTIQIISQNINWNCNGAAACQVLSNNAAVMTGNAFPEEDTDEKEVERDGEFDDFEVVEVIEVPDDA